MVLLGAGPKGAVPLSKATILGGAIGNFITLSRARHPKAKTHKQAERPMIDYEASTFMQSGELLGVVFGVLLNGFLPAILIYNSYKTFAKGFASRKKEDAAFKKAAEDEAATVSGKAAEDEAAEGKAEPSETTLAPSGSVIDLSAAATPPPDSPLDEAAAAVDIEAVKVDVKAEANHSESPPSSSTEAGSTGELELIYAEDSKQFPLWAWALLAPMTIYTMVYSIVKKIIQKDANCQDWAYWLWYATPVPILGGFMWYTAILLGKRHERKLAAGYEYLPADIRWDAASLKRFPVTALLAGVTAGLLGIGGGMVIGPLFLAIGMEPQVGTSSCAFMILWTAFSGVFIYGADGHLGAELGCWCVAFGIISGQLGQTFVGAVLKKTGRPSYVVFLLASIIALACCAMGTTLIVKMAQGDYDANDKVEENEKLFYFGSDFGCDASPSQESTMMGGTLPRAVALITLVGYVLGCLLFCV